jgi:hypothetical protein
MRNEIKKYYESQFGSFINIRAKEISELNNYELQLLELPQIFYNKSKQSKTGLAKKLQKFLAISKN